MRIGDQRASRIPELVSVSFCSQLRLRPLRKNLAMRAKSIG
jgi:hypothetical protein